jgi:DNA repair protein RecO (recombination protein O)
VDSLQKAYVLHVRPYSDSRYLVEWLVENSGVITTIARTPKKSSGIPWQSFRCYYLASLGRQGVKTLTHCEPSDTPPVYLTGRALFCGLYINEILQRLLHNEEINLELFHYYERTIKNLACADSAQLHEISLRQFELILLEKLGFAIEFNMCSVSGEMVQEAASYVFVPGSGIRRALPRDEPHLLISGHALLAIAHNDWQDTQALSAAKRICRLALRVLLGSRPLKSRELFQ